MMREFEYKGHEFLLYYNADKITLSMDNVTFAEYDMYKGGDSRLVSVNNKDVEEVIEEMAVGSYSPVFPLKPYYHHIGIRMAYFNRMKIY